MLCSFTSSFAEEGFCLSGGFRNGYSCETPLFSELDSRSSSFSVQLLERGSERRLSELEQVVHISELEDNKRLVYLGEYATQALGMAALQETLRKYGSDHYPMLVALTPSEQMPRIRLVAEPNIASALMEVPANLTGGRDEVLSAGASPQVYAIQLAAFNGVNDAKQFSDQLNAPNLLCRRKSNGLYAVYYRHFKASDVATSHLGDYPFITALGGYVVALSNVEFTACSELKTPALSVDTMLADRKNSSNPELTSKPAESIKRSAVEKTDNALSNEIDIEERNQPSIVASSLETVELVYSLQIAAFKQRSAAQRFIADNAEVPMLCRTKDNGLSAVYFGRYHSVDEARSHMNDYALLARQKSYAVKLTNVTFEQCR